MIELYSPPRTSFTWRSSWGSAFINARISMHIFTKVVWRIPKYWLHDRMSHQRFTLKKQFHELELINSIATRSLFIDIEVRMNKQVRRPLHSIHNLTSRLSVRTCYFFRMETRFPTMKHLLCRPKLIEYRSQTVFDRTTDKTLQFSYNSTCITKHREWKGIFLAMLTLRPKTWTALIGSFFWNKRKLLDLIEFGVELLALL